MDNREAIEWLKGCVVAYEVDNKGKPNGNVTCDLIQDVIDMAISALEKREEDRWIPVTERLPEVKQRVLAQRKDGFMEVKVCIDGGHLAWFYSGIVAWRPLPEAYMKEET